MYSKTFEVLVNEEHISIDCVFEIEPLIRGNYNSLPENCYPDEGGFAELVDAYIGEEQFDINLIDKKELNKICAKAYYDWDLGRAENRYDETAHYRSC